MGRQKSHRDFGYSVVREKTQTEGVIPVAKTTVTLDDEIVQSLLQGDLTCLQSVVKDLIRHALEAKAEEILQAERYERTPDRKELPEQVPQQVGDDPTQAYSSTDPQMRGGGLDAQELKLLPRFEQAFLLTLLEMVINGVSTRKVRRVVEELCGLEVSRAQSASCAAFARTGCGVEQNGPLRGRTIPFFRLTPW